MTWEGFVFNGKMPETGKMFYRKGQTWMWKKIDRLESAWMRKESEYTWLKETKERDGKKARNYELVLTL